MVAIAQARAPHAMFRDAVAGILDQLRAKVSVDFESRTHHGNARVCGPTGVR